MTKHAVHMLGIKLTDLQGVCIFGKKKVIITEMKMMYCGKFESAGWMGLINKAADGEQQAKNDHRSIALSINFFDFSSQCSDQWTV